MMTGRRVLILALALSVLAVTEPSPASSAESPTPDGREAVEFFEKAVRPVLVERCWSCHGGASKKGKVKGGLNLTSRAGVLAGGDSGPSAVEGKPEESLLVRAIRYHDEPRMPPQRRLGEVEIQDLSRWVELGLPWPSAEAGKTVDKQPAAAPSSSSPSSSSSSAAATSRTWGDRGRDHWAFRPVSDPAVPAVRNDAWPHSPIDRFVLAELERHGMSSAPRADRRTLIRRATFDLTGLPPTLQEVEAFVADDGPGAWARVVDRLLASPHHGERWGRHWLDLARYADTAGETADFPVPEAYRYRNYVIDAFNGDLPYNEFIAEQIAGDLIAGEGPPERHDARIIATGFLAVARRFGFDPQNYHHLTIEDTIDTLGKTVLGLSVACARCHDHKFDPIGAEDYYALYGILSSSRYPFPGSEESKRPRDFVPIGRGPAVKVAYAMAESDHPASARIQRRGDPGNLGAEVPRRFLAVLGGRDRPPVTRGSGRRELAAWLTDPEQNPLTARVMVNRVWQHHFGRGLVATPSDFGSRGQAPSHPELLDWLARRFVADGWSIKALHRRILLSGTYQMASTGFDESASATRDQDQTRPHDPENVWLSHFNRRRLDAESLRDAILWLGGDLEIGPGAAHPFPPVGQWNFTQHAPFQAVYETQRRSIYLMTQRIRRHPYLSLFDGADPNSSTAGRNVTTVPTQALFFFNNPLVHLEAGHLAERLLREGRDDRDRIDLAHRLAFARPATDRERDESIRYLNDARAELAGSGITGPQSIQDAWASFARTLLASNEFAYID
jgi:hypothetical protein